MIRLLVNAKLAIHSNYHTMCVYTQSGYLWQEMLFNNPLTAAPGMILDNVDNNRWEVPIPQKEKKRGGPYTITQVYCNGTIRMQRGSIYEHIKNY